MSSVQNLIQTLFRQEFSKIISVISRLPGVAYLDIAEDIVSDTFLQASENWEKNGIPPNPTAWLYTVAKQKTFYLFRRKRILDGKVIPAVRNLQDNFSDNTEVDFSPGNITDSQLNMMFAICSPCIGSESQIGLALRILCGFGIDEIAEAFFTTKETVNKRLHRAKEKLRAENIRLDTPSEYEISTRLDNVLHIIYLLFNEGYYSNSQNYTLRKDFCIEALRLSIMLTEKNETNLPKVNALVALMCFHTSRFEARKTNDEVIILYDSQDKSLWDNELINRGNHYLARSAQGAEISAYHIEAGIAFWHCQKEESDHKWQSILNHYDLLIKIRYSPIVALNRLYALYKVSGKAKALQEATKLNLTSSHYYHVLLGELSIGNDDNEKARGHFEKALGMVKSKKEREMLIDKIRGLNSGLTKN